MFKSESFLRDFLEHVDIISGSKLVNSIAPWLDVQNFGAWEIVKKGYAAFAAIGIALMVAFWFLDILSKASREQLNMQIWIRQIILLIVAATFVTRGITLFEGMLGLSQGLTNTLSAAVLTGSGEPGAGSEENTDAIKDSICQAYTQNVDWEKNPDEEGWTEGSGVKYSTLKRWLDNKDVNKYLTWGSTVKLSGKTIMGAFIISVSNLVIILSLVGRIIQLLVYTIIAPIAVADLFSGGSLVGSPGFRFLKKYMAIALQGALLLLIICASSWLNAMPLNDEITGALGFFQKGALPILTALACMTLAGRAQAWASDIVGS